MYVRALAMLAALTALPALGCSADESTAGSGAAPDAATSAGNVDAAVPGSVAKLAGSITRTAAPMGDGMGDVYVALFDRDPVAQMSQAQVVARQRLVGVNLAGAGASIAYELADITPRAADYYLVAFLDDNGNVDAAHPEQAGPDKGDLVSLDGLAAPKVAVTSAADHAHPITLNSVLPF